LQTRDQFTTRAQGNARDVVNRFVGVELNALATHVRECVNDVAANVLQSELKRLEQPDRTGSKDDGVGLDHSHKCA
jgi:hypothetical protein